MIVDHLYKSYRLMRVYFINLRINRQKKEMAYLYDAIIDQQPEEDIYQAVRGKVPLEALKILSQTYEYRQKFSQLKLPRLIGRVSISVVIPHFNQDIYLDQNLSFLTRQTDLADEVIVVDDKSTNFRKVESICVKYQKRLNLKLIRSKTKLFAGGAKQLGAEKASGDIVMMHDADDISHPDRVKLTRKFFALYPEALHLNVGFVRFPKDYFLNYINPFKTADLQKYIITTDKIISSMRQVFIDQRFSIFTKFGSRIGYYGYNGEYEFGAQAGHVAYRRELAAVFKWITPHNIVFTKFEDYSFNLLLLISCLRSYQINLPLIYYRIGTTTNLVNY